MGAPGAGGGWRVGTGIPRVGVKGRFFSVNLFILSKPTKNALSTQRSEQTCLKFSKVVLKI